MASTKIQKPLPDPTLGLQFPRRLLNLFPTPWKRNYLIQRSGGESEPEGFGFTEHFRDARRIVLAWPKDPVEILEGFPAARAMVDSLPADCQCLHLCESSCADLVQGLFPHAVLEWNAAELAWYAPSVQSLVRELRAFAPDTALILTHTAYPLVLQAALRASGAKARIGWESAVGAPFANTRLKSDPATPHAARFFQSLDLWRYAGLTPRGHWTHLQPDTGRHAEALREWEAKRAVPETTWLFVQDAANLDALDADLFETLQAKIRMREEGRFTLGAVLWNPEAKPISRQGKWLDAPVFNESDFSALLAAVDGARGVIGFHSFALHFAALVEVRCLALLDPSESLHDATGLNPLYEVEWM
jgi:ADP-heptose:LPS heptosyltransferase